MDFHRVQIRVKVPFTARIYVGIPPRWNGRDSILRAVYPGHNIAAKGHLSTPTPVAKGKLWKPKDRKNASNNCNPC